MHSQSLIEGKITPVLIQFAIPYLLASILNSLYGAVDLMIVGQFADAAAVAGVSIGTQIIWTCNWFITGITMGGTVLLAQYIGAENRRAAGETILTLLLLFSAIAVLLAPIMAWFAPQFVGWMQTPEAAVSHAVSYTQLTGVGLLFIVGYQAVSSIFRGLGDSKTPVKFIAIACVLNILLDLLFVAGMKMGATGAALATVIAQAVSFGGAVWYLLRGPYASFFAGLPIRIDRKKAARIFRIGLPLALQETLVNLSFLLITAIINGMGVLAAASVGVVEKIITFTMLPQIACSSSVSMIVAQNLGAGKPERGRKALGVGIMIAVSFGAVCCLYAQIFPQTLTRLFASDPELVALSAEYLRSYSIDCILVGFAFCLNSYFSGCGRTTFTLIQNLLATFLVRVPVSWLFSKMAGVTLYHIGFAAPLASLMTTLLCAAYFLYLRRRGLDNHTNVIEAAVHTSTS